MKVSELVDKLKAMPQDGSVYFNDYGGLAAVYTVAVDDEGDAILNQENEYER